MTLPETEFALITDLIRQHATDEPRRRALSEGERQLDDGALDALMDRIAAALQRDGMQVGDSLAMVQMGGGLPAVMAHQLGAQSTHGAQGRTSGPEIWQGRLREDVAAHLDDSVGASALASRSWGLKSRSMLLLPGELEVSMRVGLVAEQLARMQGTESRAGAAGCRRCWMKMGRTWNLGTALTGPCFWAA